MKLGHGSHGRHGIAARPLSASLGEWKQRAQEQEREHPPATVSVRHDAEGMLARVAKKGGMAARISAWVGVKAYHLIRKGPSAENRPQTAKPIENARSDSQSTRALPAGRGIAWEVPTELVMVSIS